jgi:2-hydroxychromene-2-carboxylate isomerase
VTKRVDFIFDFASPNAYFVHKVLPAFAERTGAAVNYVPCLLGGIFRATGNSAPMVKNANIKNLREYDMLEIQRFVAKHGLGQFAMNPHFPVNTLLIMRGALVAEQDGDLMRYVDAVFQCMWEAGAKMDDPETAASALTASGLNGPALLARTQEEAVKARLIENTEAAVSRGAFGIPTFFIGEEMFYGKERLGQMEEMLGAH